MCIEHKRVILLAIEGAVRKYHFVRRSYVGVGKLKAMAIPSIKSILKSGTQIA
jgi:hypothetical protein